jgi:hypothetical protein
MSGDAGSIASRWPTGKVQEVALRVTPRVDPSELVGRIAVAEVLAPDPSGRCCSPTTTPPGNWALSTSGSCRPWRPSASSSRWSSDDASTTSWRVAANMVLPSTSPLASASSRSPSKALGERSLRRRRGPCSPDARSHGSLLTASFSKMQTGKRVASPGTAAAAHVCVKVGRPVHPGLHSEVSARGGSRAVETRGCSGCFLLVTCAGRNPRAPLEGGGVEPEVVR